MALINCPECKKEISDKAEKCPTCGNPISPGTEAIKEETPSKEIGGKEEVGGSFIVGILLVISGLIMAFSGIAFYGFYYGLFYFLFLYVGMVLIFRNKKSSVITYLLPLIIAGFIVPLTFETCAPPKAKQSNTAGEQITQPQPSTPKKPVIPSDPKIQEKRLAFIQQLINDGVFQKVDFPSERLPHVWVTPFFYDLNFDEKQSSINIVYAYSISKNPKLNIVVLFDSKTGKEIGNYAEVYGGLKLK